MIIKKFSIFFIVFQSLEIISQCFDTLSLEELLADAAQIDTGDENKTDSSKPWKVNGWGADGNPLEWTIEQVESGEFSSRSRPRSLSGDSSRSVHFAEKHVLLPPPNEDQPSLDQPVIIARPQLAEKNWSIKILLIDNSALNANYPTEELFKVFKLNETTTTEHEIYDQFGKITSELEQINLVASGHLTDYKRYVSEKSEITREFLFKVEKVLRELKYRAKILAKKIQSWKQLWVRRYTSSTTDESTVYNGCQGNPNTGRCIRLTKLRDRINEVNEDHLFILSFQFDCIDYFFQRYFHELAKTIFDISAIQTNAMGINDIELSVFDSLPNFSIPMDAKFVKIDKNSDFMSDNAVVALSRKNYGEKITTLGLWIEKVFRESKFYEQGADNASFCTQKFPTHIWKKPESLKEWTVRVFNVNARFSPDAYNCSKVRFTGQNKINNGSINLPVPPNSFIKAAALSSASINPPVPPNSFIKDTAAISNGSINPPVPPNSIIKDTSTMSNGSINPPVPPNSLIIKDTSTMSNASINPSVPPNSSMKDNVTMSMESLTNQND